MSNPLMYIIYLLLKVLVKSVLWIFYAKTHETNPERLRFKGPTIVVSNHPNTLIDALQTVSRIKRQGFFLANAGLFKSRFGNWFFNTFYCIPIQRPQDVNGKKINNAESFARCDEFLGNGGCLYIAPEGGSVLERRLRQFKTGTARIALSAENKNGFDLDLHILPVGLNYDQPNLFRTNLLVNVGKALSVKKYQELYQQDPFEAARTLTDDLEMTMKSLIIDTIDEEEDQLLRKLEEMLDQEAPLPPAERFQRIKKLIVYLRDWQKTEKQALQTFVNHVNDYFSVLEEHNQTHTAIALNEKRASQSFDFLKLLMGLPFFLFGWINNYLPAKSLVWIYEKGKFYIGYEATVKTVLGLVTFPLFYFLTFKVVNLLLPSPAPWIYLLAMPPLGLFAWYYKKFYDRWAQVNKFKKLSKNKPAIARQLLEQKDKLTKKLMGMVNLLP